MITPSTPTAADALADRKRILDENAGYVSRRDTAKAEALRWEGVVEQAKRELANIEDLTRTAISNGQHVEESISERRKELEGLIVRMESRLAATEEAIRKADDDLSAKSRHLDAADEQLAELKREIGRHVIITQDAHAEHESGRLERLAAIEALDGQILAKKAELEGMEGSQRAREDALTAKEERLIEKEANLHIYEARVNRLARDAGYPHKIQA